MQLWKHIIIRGHLPKSDLVTFAESSQGTYSTSPPPNDSQEIGHLFVCGRKIIIEFNLLQSQ